MTLRWICSVKSVSCLKFRAHTRHSIPDIVSSVLIRKEGSSLLKGLAVPFLTYLRILFSYFAVRVHHWFMVNKVSCRTQDLSLQNSFSARWSLSWMRDWGYLFARQDFALPFVNTTSFYAKVFNCHECFEWQHNSITYEQLFPVLHHFKTPWRVHSLSHTGYQWRC